MGRMRIDLIKSLKTKWTVHVSEGEKVVFSAVMHPTDLLEAFCELGLEVHPDPTDSTIPTLLKHGAVEPVRVQQKQASGEEGQP